MPECGLFRVRRPRRLAAAVVLCLFVGPIPAKTDVQPIMHEVFDALAYLLPLSMAGKSELTDLDRRLVAQHLSKLEGGAAALAAHAHIRDREFELLARSFERAAKQVKQAFASDFAIDSYYALSDLTANCVSCHSRLPDQQDFILGQRLMARIDTSELDRQELAQLYVATRQFDFALNKLEELLVDTQLSPVDIDLDGVLVRYLSINIAVSQDMTRPVKALSSFRERGDMPFYLRRYVDLWLREMNELGSELRAAPDFDLARRLYEGAQELASTPLGREGLVRDLIAASMLRRLLDEKAVAKPQLGEAYFMLAVINLRTLEPDAAVPQLEFLLESAIESAPFTPVAESAFALLEEVGYVAYPGLSALDSAHPLIDVGALRQLVGRKE